VRRGPRVVLGVVDGLHDAGAALVADGRLVAAANEERFTRVKLQGGMPERSIDAVLRTAGAAAADVDVVAVGGRATPTLATRLVRPLQHAYGPSLGVCLDRPWHPLDVAGDLARYRLGLTRGRGGRLDGALAAAVLRRRLPPGLRRTPLRLVDHHLAHAESARRTAGEGRWLVVTADAHGDGRSLTVQVADGESLSPHHEEGVDASLGAFYAWVTRHLGFLPGRHEGKVLGLSASGDAARVRVEFPFRWEGGRLAYSGEWGLRARRTMRALAGASREDVAAWVQQGTERVLLEGVARWLRETRTTRVALAGGVFANVLLNARIAGLDGVERLHVFPHMGDGGLAAGAALHVAGARPAPLATAFLGPEPTGDECLRAARDAGLEVERPEDPDLALVEALVRGEAVARATGRLELGPRALGNRSVLAPARDPAVTARLNAALRRDDFMPFAPVLREEDAGACLVGHERATEALRFMTVALPTREAFRRACPAAVHVDGTARAQVVRRKDDPALHALLTRYAATTGLPALLNTSFNLHEEPIVCSAADAVRTFLATGLPLLRLGPLLCRAARSSSSRSPSSRT
jgi:carbamoyltransferase